jgi:AcrR family transcriptional regulator
VIITIIIQQEKGSKTRDRLLSAAARLIARRGYQEASLAEVAREAGLTTGAVYSNFHDKEDLFFTALANLQHSLWRTRGQHQGMDVVGALVADLVSDAEHLESSDLVPLQLELMLLACREERVRRQVAEDLHGSVSWFLERLGSRAAPIAARHGLSEQEVATVVLAMANGLILQRSIDPQAVPLDLLDRAVRLLLDAPADDSCGAATSTPW